MNLFSKYYTGDENEPITTTKPVKPIEPVDEELLRQFADVFNAWEQEQKRVEQAREKNIEITTGAVGKPEIPLPVSIAEIAGCDPNDNNCITNVLNWAKEAGTYPQNKEIIYGNATFNSKYPEYGYQKIGPTDIQAGDILQFMDKQGVHGHATTYIGKPGNEMVGLDELLQEPVVSIGSGKNVKIYSGDMFPQYTNTNIYRYVGEEPNLYQKLRSLGNVQMPTMESIPAQRQEISSVKLQHGGDIPPYYTSDPNDPRIKAYNDSLVNYSKFIYDIVPLTHEDSTKCSNVHGHWEWDKPKQKVILQQPTRTVQDKQLTDKQKSEGTMMKESFSPITITGNIKKDNTKIYTDKEEFDKTNRAYQVEYAKSSGIRQKQRPNYITKVTGHPQWGEVYFINEGGTPRVTTKAEAIRSGLQIVNKPYETHLGLGGRLGYPNTSGIKYTLSKEIQGPSHDKGGIKMNLNGQPVEVEGGELMLRGNDGSVVVIPRDKKETTVNAFEQGNQGRVKNIVNSVPDVGNAPLACHGGRWKWWMENGGDIPPFITSDKDIYEERVKAYNDSLILYNNSREDQIAYLTAPEWNYKVKPIIDRETFRNTFNEVNKNQLPTLSDDMYDNPNILPYGYRAFYSTLKQSKRGNSNPYWNSKSSIIPSGTTPETFTENISLYDKPKQKVILQQPTRTVQDKQLTDKQKSEGIKMKESISPITVTGNTKKDNTKIYTDKEEFDKANKAYQDSLSLYNANPYNRKRLKEWERAFQSERNVINIMKLHDDPKYKENIAIMFPNDKIKPYVAFQIDDKKEGMYIKPQQQPIYQKLYAKGSGIRQEQRPNYITKVTGHPQWGEMYFINEGGTPRVTTKAEAIRSGLQIIDKPYGTQYAKGQTIYEERPTQPNTAQTFKDGGVKRPRYRLQKGGDIPPFSKSLYAPIQSEVASTTRVAMPDTEKMYQQELIRQDKQRLVKEYETGDKPKVMQEFEDKYGQPLHTYRYNSDPVYRANANQIAEVTSKMSGSITEPPRQTPPNLMFMFPSGSSQEAQNSIEDVQMGVIGSVLPIPGLEQMGQVKGLTNLVKPLVKGFNVSRESIKGAEEFANISKKIEPIVSSVDDVSKQITKQPWQLEELPGLHLKSTMKGQTISKIVEPKTGLVNVEQALGIIGKEAGGVDKVKLVREALGDNLPLKMDYNKFRKTVQDKLIPLERQFSTSNSNYGIERLGYSRIESGTEHLYYPSQLKETNVIENQTLILGNKGKFGRGSSAHGNPEETLGHVHFLRDAETPDVLTVTQIQSDAFQGTHRIMPKVGKEGEMIADLTKRAETSKLHGDYYKAEIENFTQKQLLDKNHQERYLQELVDYAGKRGDVNKVRIPTLETTAKIQGYKEYPISRELIDETKIKLQKTIDENLVSDKPFIEKEKIDIKYAEDLLIQGKNKAYSSDHRTILNKYADTPKMVKKVLKTDTKIVTDSKGNTWYEFDIPKSFKEGKAEIKALSLGAGIASGSMYSLQNNQEERPKYKLQNGGDIPPYYTTDPNDPRIKAYQDSLYNYNLYLKQKQAYKEMMSKARTEDEAIIIDEAIQKRFKEIDKLNNTTGRSGEEVVYEKMFPENNFEYGIRSWVDTYIEPKQSVILTPQLKVKNNIKKTLRRSKPGFVKF